MPAAMTDAEAAGRLRGIGIYCLAFFCFTCLDTCAKFSGHYVPALEVAWVRFVGHLLCAALILRPWRDLAPYRTERPFLQFLRSVFLFGSTVLNFLALRKLQLAETTTINFAGAFVVAGFAGPMLGEWIGPRRWLAIAVGFVGVLIVTRPGGDAFQPVVLLSIASTFSNSFYVLLTRKLSATETAASMLVYPALVASLLLAPFALPTFVMPPTELVAVVLAVSGVFGAVGHWFLIQAHRLAPAPVLSPFVYTQTVWMIGFGYLVFGDIPGIATLIGAAVIIASGLYIFYRERVRGDR